MIGAVAVLGLCLSSAAAAQNKRDAELAFENDRLNRTYRSLLQRLSPSDRRQSQTAQRPWLRFRDADCAFGWGDPRDCLLSGTSDREQQLRSSVYRDSRGNRIALEEPARPLD